MKPTIFFLLAFCYKDENDDTNGIFFEAEYAPYENLSFIVGGLTSASWLSFYDDGGITTIGVSGKRPVRVSDNFSLILKSSLIFNPSHKKSVGAPVWEEIRFTLW